MKRILTLMSIFLSILLTSGCVSIPLTDGGTIEISADGLTIVPAEDDGENAERSEEENDGKESSDKVKLSTEKDEEIG